MRLSRGGAPPGCLSTATPGSGLGHPGDAGSCSLCLTTRTGVISSRESIPSVHPFGLVRAWRSGRRVRMTLPASAGVRSTPWLATHLCDPSHSLTRYSHDRVTPAIDYRAAVVSRWNARGARENAQRIHGVYTTGDARPPVMEGAIDRCALALLVAATAGSRCRPLAGRSPTVLKSCVGVASQRGCAPCEGARGADPAPVWRKC
jgi:hypothetical protein